MENTRKHKEYPVWNKVAVVIVKVILGIFIFGSGAAIGWAVYTRIHLINPSWVDASVGEKLFAAIVLGGVFTLFTGLMANWRGQ